MTMTVSGIIICVNWPQLQYRLLHSVAAYFIAGIILDLNKSLHNQGILEQEHIALVHTPPHDSASLGSGGGLESPAKTEGVSTSSETFTSSEV